MLLAQTCSNIGKEFQSSPYSQRQLKNTDINNGNSKKHQSKNDEIAMNKNLLSLQKMSHRIKPGNNSNRSKSPLSTTSSSSSSISNEQQQRQSYPEQQHQHSYVSKIQNNKYLNRSTTPYNSSITPGSNKNNSTTPSPSTSMNSSLTSSPPTVNNNNNNNSHNIIAPSPVFPFDPLVLAALQKYYAALAATTTTTQQSKTNYDSLSNFAYNNAISGMLSNCIQQQQQQQQQTFNYLMPTSSNTCPDPNCFKCQPHSNNLNTCTLPGCNQCTNHLNVSTSSNSSNSNSLTNSPLKLVSPTPSNNTHYCNWLSGGNIYCGKKFSTLDQLNEHIKSHTTAELVSDLTRYYNIRSSLLNSQQMHTPSTINYPFLNSSNQANQLHNNRFNPYSKPVVPPQTTPISNTILPTSISNQLPYLGYNNSAPNISTSPTITTPNMNFYSQLALLSNNI